MCAAYLSRASPDPLCGADRLHLIDSFMLIIVRDFPTRPHLRFASIARHHPGASGDAFLPPGASMNDSPIVTAGPPDHFVAPLDEGLLAFTDTLRLSVRAKVAAEQNRGLSLSEIVVQVREMVRLAEGDPQHHNHFSSRAFRAMSRQAVGWCVESYRPLVFAAGRNPSEPPTQRLPESLPPVLAPAAAASATLRFPASSPTYRGLP